MSIVEGVDRPRKKKKNRKSEAQTKRLYTVGEKYHWIEYSNLLFQLISICFHSHSLQYSGYTPPQTVNVSVKFPRHCKRAGAVSAKRSRLALLLPVFFTKSCRPTAPTFQPSPDHESLKHQGLQRALIHTKSPLKRFT